MSRRIEAQKPEWRQIGKEKLEFDVDRRNVSLVETLTVIQNSPLPKAVQKDLSLAVCTPERSLNGFGLVSDKIEALTELKESLERELEKSKTLNASKEDELTELRIKNQTQAEELTLLSSEKKHLNQQISNVTDELENRKEEMRAQADQISTLLLENESQLANKLQWESEKQVSNGEEDKLKAELIQTKMEVDVLWFANQSLITSLGSVQKEPITEMSQVLNELEEMKLANLALANQASAMAAEIATLQRDQRLLLTELEESAVKILRLSAEVEQTKLEADGLREGNDSLIKALDTIQKDRAAEMSNVLTELKKAKTEALALDYKVTTTTAEIESLLTEKLENHQKEARAIFSNVIDELKRAVAEIERSRYTRSETQKPSSRPTSGQFTEAEGTQCSAITLSLLNQCEGGGMILVAIIFWLLLVNRETK